MNREINLLEPKPEPVEVSTGGPPELEDAALAGIAGEIVGKILPHTEASAPAMLFNFLSGFGNMAGRNAYTVAGGKHYPNLFGVLVGSTNGGRKGTSWNCIKDVLRQIDPDWAETRQASGLSSGEGLIYHVRDERSEQKPIKERGKIVDYQNEVIDEGVTDKRLFLIEEEFASVLNRMKGKENTLSAIIRSAWDGGNLRNLNKNSPDFATAPHISIAAHITKPEASELVGKVDCQNGLVNRFLWVYTQRSKYLPNAGLIPVHELSQEIEAIQRALRNAEVEREVPFDSQAQELWNSAYYDLASEKPGLIGAVTARAAPQVRRLSLIFALIEGREAQTVKDLEAALAFWRYCERSAEWLFGTPFNHPDADKIWETLRKKPEGMDRTEINREVFNNHAKAEQLDESFAILEKAGVAYPKREDTGGRSRELWIPLIAAK